MKNGLPNNITVNNLKKVQESLKVAREKNKKRNVYAEKYKYAARFLEESQSMRQFVELQRLSESSNQSSQT